MCGGGRYDGLIELLGGRPAPAAGFALGVDRVAQLRRTVADACEYRSGDVYVVVQDANCMAAAMASAQALRVGVPGLRVRLHAGGGGMSAQFRRADRCGARWAMIVGEDEIAQNRVSLKWLREDRPQVFASTDEAAAMIRDARADGRR